jgi:hypothetical protein
MADTTYQPKVYRKQGGEELIVADGGLIDVEAGGSLKFAGVAIAANAPQVNISSVPASGMEVVAEANIITAEESGKTFFLNLAGGFQSTLPAPAAGLKFTFIVKTAPTTAYTIVTNGANQQVLKGLVLVAADGTGEVSAGGTTATFVAGQAKPGDRIDMICDGTIWYMKGFAQVAAGITITGE